MCYYTGPVAGSSGLIGISGLNLIAYAQIWIYSSSARGWGLKRVVPLAAGSSAMKSTGESGEPFGNRGRDLLQSRLETGGLDANNSASLGMHSKSVSTAIVRGGLRHSGMDAVQSLGIAQGCDADRAGNRGEGERVLAGMPELVVAVYFVVAVSVLDPVDIVVGRQTV